MRPGRLFIILLFLPALLQSCFKKDEALPFPQRGNVITDTIALTEDYRYQVYFRLDSGTVVSTCLRTSTDLGFECSPGGYHIILNTADFMKIADLGVREFGQAADTAGAVWKFDKSDGNTDSIATGLWFHVTGTDTVGNGHVFALDLGKDEYGNNLGLKQLIFDSLKQGTYYFRYCGIHGDGIRSGNVSKDPSVSYLYFNLRTSSVVRLEPPMASFDLFFTQYTTLLFTSEGAAYPYLVTGVLSNRYNVTVSADSLDAFSSIDLATAQKLRYTKALDAIGYDWKTYNFAAGSYTVRTGISYVVTDTRGYYYKMRFTGFYNKKGEKGYPSIEFQRL